MCIKVFQPLLHFLFNPCIGALLLCMFKLALAQFVETLLDGGMDPETSWNHATIFRSTDGIKMEIEWWERVGSLFFTFSLALLSQSTGRLSAGVSMTKIPPTLVIIRVRLSRGTFRKGPKHVQINK
jgi:hypothetical protein